MARESWPLSRLTEESDLVIVGRIIGTERIGVSPTMSCCYDRYLTSIHVESVLKNSPSEFSAKELMLEHDLKLPSIAWREGVDGLVNPPRPIDWKSDSRVFKMPEVAGDLAFVMFLKKGREDAYEPTSGHQLAILAVCSLDGIFDSEPTQAKTTAR